MSSVFMRFSEKTFFNFSPFVGGLPPEPPLTFPLRACGFAFIITAPFFGATAQKRKNPPAIAERFSQIRSPEYPLSFCALPVLHVANSTADVSQNPPLELVRPPLFFFVKVFRFIPSFGSRVARSRAFTPYHVGNGTHLVILPRAVRRLQKTPLELRLQGVLPFVLGSQSAQPLRTIFYTISKKRCLVKCFFAIWKKIFLALRLNFNLNACLRLFLFLLLRQKK